MKEISFEIPDMDERGVSPVIGVILMVAITVILAAVIASAVLGFGSSTQSSATAGVETNVDGANVTVTVIDLGDNTEGAACVTPDGATNSTVGGIGSTLNCGPGDNVLAVGEGDTGNATIRTNI